MEIPLENIDRAIALGAKVNDWPEVIAARAAQKRLSDLESDRQRITGADAAVRRHAIATEYAAGKLTAEQMALAAASLNAGADRVILSEVVDEAQAIVAGPHIVALRKAGDRWIEELRPEAIRRARLFATVAARLPNRPFDQYGVDPTEWRNLGRALDALNEVLDLAEALGARPQRWLHPERQPDGLTHSHKTAWSIAVMMHHAGCEAGVWTRDEVRAAAPRRQPAEPLDLPPAA